MKRNVLFDLRWISRAYYNGALLRKFTRSKIPKNPIERILHTQESQENIDRGRREYFLYMSWRKKITFYGSKAYEDQLMINQGLLPYED